MFRQLRNPEKSDSINFSGSEYLERCESKRLKKWSYSSYVLRFIQLSERHIGPKLGCGRLRVLRAFTSAMFESSHLWEFRLPVTALALSARRPFGPAGFARGLDKQLKIVTSYFFLPGRCHLLVRVLKNVPLKQRS